MITRYYPCTLTLEAPLLLAALEADPNSARSLDFIPGSALRGAAARGLCVAGLDRSDPYRFRHLILSGRVSYLNAHITAAGRRCLPAPVSFRKEKHGSTVHDLAAWTGSESEAAGPLTRIEAPFLTLGMAELIGAKVQTAGRAHHQRDRSVGRPVQETGAIFHFEAIDAGQEFQGLIAVSGEDESAISQDATVVREALGPVALLGRSRRAGYGGAASVRWGESLPREVEGERILSGYVSAAGEFRLLLTSDYLGRQRETGQPDPTALVKEVEARLVGRAQVLRRFLAFRTVGGFNRKWGLELPQWPAVQAGSVLVLRASQHLSGSDLVEMEHTGLGERRAEGFGRFVFLDAPGGTVSIRAAEAVLAEPPAASPLVLQMQARLLEEALGRRIVEAAAQVAATAEHIPTRSLLGRLRLPLRLPAAEGLKQLRSWLSSEDAGALRRPARRQLEVCHLGDPGHRWSLVDWLREHARRSDLGRMLGYDELARDNHLIAREEARKMLAAAEREIPTRAAFIDAVLAALARRGVRKEAPHAR